MPSRLQACKAIREGHSVRVILTWKLIDHNQVVNRQKADGGLDAAFRNARVLIDLLVGQVCSVFGGVPSTCDKKICLQGIKLSSPPQPKVSKWLDHSVSVVQSASRYLTPPPVRREVGQLKCAPGSVRGRGGLCRRAGGVAGVAIEDVGLWWSCELQPRTEEDPDDREQYDADRFTAKA